MLLHGGEYLCTEITALLLVALLLAVFTLRGLRLVRLLRLLLTLLFAVGALLVLLRRLEYLKCIFIGAFTMKQANNMQLLVYKQYILDTANA